MPIAKGRRVYSADVAPVRAIGASYTDKDLDTALQGPVASIIRDAKGTSEVESILRSVATTDFSNANVSRILSTAHEPEDWRVGEGLAEAFLVDHCNCEFPWPAGRDLKNPSASPAGTDLVGFHKQPKKNDYYCFAFGEVKTSDEERWPPSAMYGRSGLKKQLEDLRDSLSVKDNLVKYLTHHSKGADWFPRYQSAAKRYLNNPADVSLFGILIRDVEPKREDLAGRAKGLATGCPRETSIELRAMYLPSKSICTLAARATKIRGVGHGKN